MKSNASTSVFTLLLMMVFAACTPSDSTSGATGTIEKPVPSVTADQPTRTPEPQVLIQEAALYRTDFESGYPPELYDWSQSWHIESEADGNSILCNEISEEWSSVQFGLDEWSNYAISLRMKFLSANEAQEAEAYIRISQEFEGYRANISNNEWAAIGYYPPYSDLGGTPVSVNQHEWFQVQVQFVEDHLSLFLDGERILEVNDDRRTSGRAGIGAGPNSTVCVDDILVWGVDGGGNPVESPAELVIEPYDGVVYTIREKVGNRPTIPVFYPWSGNCGQVLWFDCDTDEKPYSLVWISAGFARDIESTQAVVSQTQSVHMQSDSDTLYLISEEWHYWNLGWRSLSPDSRFYLDEVFQFHVNSEYGETKVINFEHPDWPGVMAEKALNFKNAGFDGMILDWWHNGAGNGRPEADVEVARLAISSAIRERVGDDFILMGNVNWSVDDPTAQFLSGVFLELWKPDASHGYALRYQDENVSGWTPSIERMEDLLQYWDANLQWPKIIAFEPWKITTGDYVADRTTEENVAYAKLFAAMALVIPENGYILYADNNDDWDGGDHQHAYYDFYRTDFGKPTSGRVRVVEGVAVKHFEHGVIAYNRTLSEHEVRLRSGEQFTIGPLQGLFLEGY